MSLTTKKCRKVKRFVEYFNHSDYRWLKEFEDHIRNWYGSRMTPYISKILDEFIANPIWIHDGVLNNYKHELITVYADELYMPGEMVGECPYADCDFVGSVRMLFIHYYQRHGLETGVLVRCPFCLWSIQVIKINGVFEEGRSKLHLLTCQLQYNIKRIQPAKRYEQLPIVIEFEKMLQSFFNKHKLSSRTQLPILQLSTCLAKKGPKPCSFFERKKHAEILNLTVQGNNIMNKFGKGDMPKFTKKLHVSHIKIDDNGIVILQFRHVNKYNDPKVIQIAPTSKPAAFYENIQHPYNDPDALPVCTPRTISRKFIEDCDDASYPIINDSDDESIIQEIRKRIPKRRKSRSASTHYKTQTIEYIDGTASASTSSSVHCPKKPKTNDYDNENVTPKSINVTTNHSNNILISQPSISSTSTNGQSRNAVINFVVKPMGSSYAIIDGNEMDDETIKNTIINKTTKYAISEVLPSPQMTGDVAIYTLEPPLSKNHDEDIVQSVTENYNADTIANEVEMDEDIVDFDTMLKPNPMKTMLTPQLISETKSESVYINIDESIVEQSNTTTGDVNDEDIFLENFVNIQNICTQKYSPPPESAQGN